MMSRLSPWWLWAVLSLPGVAWTWQAATSTDPRIVHILVHPTGEWAARALIVTLMATPLVLLLRGWRGPRWLKKNRRYFGVASFGYAALHTLFYVLDKGTFARVAAEFAQVWIWTGWVAFAIFVPLALSSADAAVRWLGGWWKPLQRWTYVAAVFTLAHWAALHDWRDPAAALVHFAPLAALEGYRVWFWYLRPSRRHPATA